MTTMGPQIYDLDIPQFVYLSQKPKKMAYKNNNGFPPMTSNKLHGPNPRTNSNKPPHYSTNIYASQQYKQNTQIQSGNYSNTNKSAKKFNPSQNFAKYENQYPINNYAKGNNMKGSPDKYNKIYYASTASESDSAAQSELAGFKIVVNGKTIHDETEEDYDLADDSDKNFDYGAGNGKFASSVMTIGPNAKDISLPTFV